MKTLTDERLATMADELRWGGDDRVVHLWDAREIVALLAEVREHRARSGSASLDAQGAISVDADEFKRIRERCETPSEPTPALLRALAASSLDAQGSAGRIEWQCSGCHWGFAGTWQRVCPSCGREDYWTGSVHPEARLWSPVPAPGSATDDDKGGAR